MKILNKFSKHSKLSTHFVAFALSLTGIVMTVVMTSSMAHAAIPTVDLGTADPFAILAGTPNITDAGNASVITGNVGLSPASGAGIGLLSSQVTGTIFSVDAFGPSGSVNNPGLLTIAKNDLTTAYNDAAGRTPVTTVPTELGGTTKTAGVYDSASTTFQITAGAGPLVLDGQGDPDAVFIFEMNSGATGLTVGPASTVSLINDAQACNVFWRVNTATINTTAVFKGNILALTSITVANGANIQGRLLARNGNVTLINDTITRATCAATTTGGGTTPGLPNTGIGPSHSGTQWGMIIPAGIVAAPLLMYAARKLRTV